MKVSLLAVDLGMSNTDVVWKDTTGTHMFKIENRFSKVEDKVYQAIDTVGEGVTPYTKIGITGGMYRHLPGVLGGFQINKVDEMEALGRGGLYAANFKSGLVVSAGTGTAMVAARPSEIAHVTGSAVGGGTLLGLSRLILGTANFDEIDQLALIGDASAVDVMLNEAVGGEIGRLPANANAVNLGKLIQGGEYKREDLAAGLVRLVAQVIAVIAINAASSVGLERIILIGHTMDLLSIKKEIGLVGEFYKKQFTMPENPGFATAIGVIEVMNKLIDGTSQL